MNIRAAIIDAVAQAAGVPASSIVLEHPQELSHGDFATPVALSLAKGRGVSPREVAEEIVAKISLPFIEKVEVAGPGFINFTLSRAFLSETLGAIVSLGKLWGGNESQNGKKIIVEYVNANAFKQLHIGHLLGAVIGEAVARTLEFSGATVYRESYGGDVGLHAAKAIYGIQKLGEELTPEFIGKAYAYGARAYEEDDEAQKEIDLLNKALYEGKDEELMKLHQEGRMVSLEGIQEVLAILDITPERFFFESESTPYGLEMVEKGLQAGVFTKSDGAIVFPGEEYGLHTRVFVTSKGTPTYEGKELGLESLKDGWKEHDESIILTSRDQAQYFAVLKKALSLINEAQGNKITHITNGILKLSTGKMSSRTGEVVPAKELIKEVVEKAYEQNQDEDVALLVALAAIKYEILKQHRENDVVYDVEESLSLEGDSGPYLQYALVRAKKILADVGDIQVTDVPQEAYPIERMLYRFPEAVLRASENHEPHHITQYLTEIAGMFNSFYAKEKVIGGAYEGYKLLLLQAFVQTLENGLWILNIKAPERM